MSASLSSPSNPWSVSDEAYSANDVEKNGNKFLIGNGYLGLRGTLEEHGPAELAACTISGLYDRDGDKWREPVNAPAAFGVKVSANGEACSTLTASIVSHRQWLELDKAVHYRQTRLRLSGGNEITLASSRFLSLENKHLGVLRFSVNTQEDCELLIETGIDGDIWDINGPHLKDFRAAQIEGMLTLDAQTGELAIPVTTAAVVHGEKLPAPEFAAGPQSVYHRYRLQARAGDTFTFTKYIGLHTGADTEAPAASAADTVTNAATTGYESLLESHVRCWEKRWRNSDVRIEGDEDAQLALRYSIYHLLIACPTDDRASIPARGLSGQVYKGAIFWDTEIFMLPFFDHTQPELARHLVNYRYHTLDGARRKAAEYGFRGAYYAWESQETGDDACTLFNITDVLTNRPMRTYFRDKQVHISADVALAVWRHATLTGDLDVLTDGGAEVILECARFFYSYAWYKPERDRYEILDVDGPDEYHERVNNNAFTSVMARATLDIALKAVELLERERPDFCAALIERLGFAEDLPRLADMRDKLFIPAPDARTRVIEQFSDYFKLEDSTPAALKERLLDPNEYWGGANGVATSTQVIKQADVVLMLHLFSGSYDAATKAANWDYYEPRTEHGSSLSPCVYALLAAELGRTEWAYKYFLRTATIDLTGKSKQFVGPLYIGGTHPAANGGAWMAAVLGFGGLRTGEGDVVCIAPRLPSAWTGLSFRFCRRGQWFTVSVTTDEISVSADPVNTAQQDFNLDGTPRSCSPGETVKAARKNLPER
ncbi:glycoside hydrolase family 65 protein [Ruficoccus amylovorans]|uniref:Glycoside hydrolase family 65 protein n=1 Tax=Ruficoccus amylovorans TaxID=1804625 RepID=A0A842HI59_9BACT|nr:glycoside hydrolase family 65 protein [Ruficoccus amylovorans]MBC2595217.1 glycoside hydrolase family 65 protein [Ruficoccus amylovorans]